MGDYIGRQEALEIVKRTSGDYATAFCEIRKLPAADVRPVVRGEWVFAEDSVFRCSICDRICYELGAPFCYCGADMRG